MLSHFKSLQKLRTEMGTRVNVLLVTLFVIGNLCSICAEVQTKSTLRVSAVLDSPYLMLNRDGSYVGYLPDLLDKLNITYNISLAPDSQYGVQYPNGSWAGMVGELANGNADIAGLLTVITPRSGVIDFSYPVMPVSLSLLISKPSVINISTLARLLYPFNLSVWVMVIVVFVVVGTVLYVMMRFNPYEWRRMARDHEATVQEGESFTCLNSFFFVTSTLMWQGYNQAPRSIGARVLVVTWWIFTIILIVSYTANLTNLCSTGFFTSSNERELPVKSLSDIAYSDMRVGFLQGGATHRFFRESKSSVDQKIYKKVINDAKYNEFETAEYLVEQIRRNRYGNGFVAIVESPTSRYMASRKPCDLIDLKQDFSHSYFAFGLPKGSSLEKNLNFALVKLTETGEIHNLEKKWFEQQAECSDVRNPVTQRERPRFYSLDLATFSSAILIVLLGLVIGVFICLVEICVYRRTKSHANDDETKPMTVEETADKPDEGIEDVTPAIHVYEDNTS